MMGPWPWCTQSSTARIELVVVSCCGAVRRCIASGKRRPAARLAIRFSTFWARVRRSRRPAGSRERQRPIPSRCSSSASRAWARNSSPSRFIVPANAETGRSSRSIAARCRGSWSRASCSALSVGHSQARGGKGVPANSMQQMGERFSWMRSESCRWLHKPHCSGCCRRGRLPGSVAPSLNRWMCG